ncbi:MULTISPECIES: LuxR C-terminal-related transcriptional regulator [Ramlibacter]|uniref:Response regulator n=1 Tax=Ramlibacter pinisoli TaxID=2682844 RepID=A0A6N8IVE4_9BURK|nr:MULTISPECIES: response regulator transcription factor [Ramlibacter]MBA2964948.1 response regulator transcription factor [Ramlibacter sp. CGMCC 1.13660]MVQ29913.1 response regulator [Ramlibacter pinisoli]
MSLERSDSHPATRDARSASEWRSRGDEGRPQQFATAPHVWPATMRGQPGAPVRVTLVDADPHARGVIARELMDDARTLVAGQAGSLRDGRRLLREGPFDVLMVDVSLGEGAGFELVSQARKLDPQVEVIALSRALSEEDAARAFDLGAAGYLWKQCWFMSYVEPVLQVANGGAAITPALSRRLLLKARRQPDVPAPPVASVCGTLSAREHEVLRMIASGLTSSQIAEHLAIGCTTVNSHIKNLYLKLHVRSRAQAVSCANSRGLL